GAPRIDLAAGGGPGEVDGAADLAAQCAFQRRAALLHPDQLEVPLAAPVHHRVPAEELPPQQQACSRLDGHVVPVPFGAVLGGIAAACPAALAVIRHAAELRWATGTAQPGSSRAGRCLRSAPSSASLPSACTRRAPGSSMRSAS